jgi:zeaxanthin glucosyltransferase
MAHFGLLSYHGAGHLNPLIALSQTLVARGHRVTFFLPPQLESRILRHGLEFFPIDLWEASPADQHDKECSRPEFDWIRDIRARLGRIDREMDAYIRSYREAIKQTSIDVLIMGEIALVGPTVAEILDLPYVVISTSIPHNFGWDAPQSLQPTRTWQESLQRKIFEVSIFCMKGPVRRILNRHRIRAGLSPITGTQSHYPELTHITQWPRCISKSPSELPERFFYTGPFCSGATRTYVEFPWDKLTGRSVVYASLGTTLKADPELYRRIAAACVGLDLQLVITLGGRCAPEDFAQLPGEPLVVKDAPQLELLERADLVITHAGPNTALEALMNGKPMLCLPITLDQPAVADRLQQLGVAEVCSPQHRGVQEIRDALLRLGSERRYSKAAKEIQVQLQALDGVTQASVIIEHALAR